MSIKGTQSWHSDRVEMKYAKNSPLWGEQCSSTYLLHVDAEHHQQWLVPVETVFTCSTHICLIANCELLNKSFHVETILFGISCFQIKHIINYNCSLLLKYLHYILLGKSALEHNGGLLNMSEMK